MKSSEEIFSTCDSPFVICVKNKSGQKQSARLFDNDEKYIRINHPDIEIFSPFTVRYTRLLTHIEKYGIKPFGLDVSTIGFKLETLILHIHKEDAKGHSFMNPFPLKLKKYDHSYPTMYCVWNLPEIDYQTFWTIDLPANSSITLRIFEKKKKKKKFEYSEQ